MPRFGPGSTGGNEWKAKLKAKTGTAWWTWRLRPALLLPGATSGFLGRPAASWPDLRLPGSLKLLDQPSGFLAHSMKTATNRRLSTKSRQSMSTMFPCCLLFTAHGINTGRAASRVRARAARPPQYVMSKEEVVVCSLPSFPLRGSPPPPIWADGNSAAARLPGSAPAWAGLSHFASCSSSPPCSACWAWRPMTSFPPSF